MIQHNHGGRPSDSEATTTNETKNQMGYLQCGGLPSPNKML